MPNRAASSDVLILGGGISGLWLARELRSHGFSVIVVDQQRIAGYASTRNQGWLHEGALYAAMSQTEVAKNCYDGRSDLLAFVSGHAPEAFRESVRGYYLFRDNDELDRLHAAIDRLGTPYSAIRANHIDFETLSRDEPAIAGNGALQVAARVEDRPLDTEVLLDALAQDAHGAGVAIFPARSPLSASRLVKRSGGWSFELDGMQVNSRAVVLTSGTAILPILRTLGLGKAASELKMTKITVGVFNVPVFSNLFVVPFESERETEVGNTSPNISPFFQRDHPVEGFTVCLSGADVEIETPDDLAAVELAELALQTALDAYHPAIASHVEKHGPVPFHAYRCQKVSLADHLAGRGVILRDYGERFGGDFASLFALYPGKFTAAPVAARACAVALRDHLRQGTQGSVPMLPCPGVSRRRYFDASTHVLDVTDVGSLEIVARPQ